MTEDEKNISEDENSIEGEVLTTSDLVALAAPVTELIRQSHENNIERIKAESEASIQQMRARASIEQERTFLSRHLQAAAIVTGLGVIWAIVFTLVQADRFEELMDLAVAMIAFIAGGAFGYGLPRKTTSDTD